MLNIDFYRSKSIFVDWTEILDMTSSESDRERLNEKKSLRNDH